jgi:hypothetical protein
MAILGMHDASTHNIIHKAESNPTNYSPNFTGNWAEVGHLLRRYRMMVDLAQFQLRYGSSLLRWVEEDPGSSVWRIVVAEDIGVALAWKILRNSSVTDKLRTDLNRLAAENENKFR